MNTLREKINNLRNEELEKFMSHPVNTKIAEAWEDKAREELNDILMREPTADEILNFIMGEKHD